MATATKTCVNAAVAGVLDGIFTLKEEKRMEPKAFLSGHFFALLPTSLAKVHTSRIVARFRHEQKKKVPSNVPGYWL